MVQLLLVGTARFGCEADASGWERWSGRPPATLEPHPFMGDGNHDQLSKFWELLGVSLTSSDLERTEVRSAYGVPPAFGAVAER